MRKKGSVAEQKKRITLPAEMGGTIRWKFIAHEHMNSKGNAERLVGTELAGRGKQFTDTAWKAMDWRAKKLFLENSKCG